MLMQPPRYDQMVGASTTNKGCTGLVPTPPAGSTDKFLRGDGTWATPVNTWRGIVDNLTSNSTTSSLSANQGRILKGYIDDINTKLDGVETLLAEI